jgi:hypothetical protein
MELAANETGIRRGGARVKASFNLANLVGLRFEYVSERKEVRRTESAQSARRAPFGSASVPSSGAASIRR